jgi:hypothetical protein
MRNMFFIVTTGTGIETIFRYAPEKKGIASICFNSIAKQPVLIVSIEQKDFETARQVQTYCAIHIQHISACFSSRFLPRCMSFCNILA